MCLLLVSKKLFRFYVFDGGGRDHFFPDGIVFRDGAEDVFREDLEEVFVEVAYVLDVSVFQ